MATVARRPLARAVRAALGHLAKLVDVNKAASLIAHGLPRNIVTEAVDWKQFTQAMRKPFAIIGELHNEAALHGTRRINASFRTNRRSIVVKDTSIPSGYAFDRFSADTQTALRDYQDALISQMTLDARNAIEAIILMGQRLGWTPEEIAADIRDTIGLTDRMALAAINYRNMLAANDPTALTRQISNTADDAALQAAIDAGTPLDDATIADMTDNYASNYLDYRANMIAQTESVRAASMGLHDSYQQAIDSGLLTQESVTRYWQTALDERTCDICDGIPDANPDGVGVGEDFDSDDGPVSDPPLHPNCFPAGTLVSAGSGIAAATARWHDGELVVICTARGKKLAGTPNHPVLTSNGWLALNKIKHGDYVIGRVGSERMSGVGKDDENMPAAIEDVARAAFKSGEMTPRKVPTTAEYFHGDGADGEIAIVAVHRRLSGERDTAFGKKSGQPILKMADTWALSFLARCGNLLAMFCRLLLPLDGRMCFSHLALTGGGGHEGPLRELGITVATDWNRRAQEMASNDRTADAKLARQLIRGSSGEVEPDEVISIEVYAFHGMVYNLETGAGHYTANGIISHNCRCSIEYVTNLDMLPADDGSGDTSKRLTAADYDAL